MRTLVDKQQRVGRHDGGVMNILVVHGSKLGGTAGIASSIGETLREAGFAVDVLPARQVRDLKDYDAVVIGGGLYAGRWYKDARRFVLRHAAALRQRPVWFFSSGPLDDSASQKDLPPTEQVQQLMGYVGATEHATFGGRLEADARGFIASKMAKQRAGDWRNPERIETWAREIAIVLAADAERVGPRPARPAMRPLPSRATALVLCLFAGISAFFGGASLAGRPDGSLIGMPVSVLRHSPFHDFLVPGLLLLVVIGLGNLWAAFLHAIRSDYASLGSFLSGSALVVWMVVEMILLRSFHAVQVAYLLVGLALVAESIRQARQLLGPMAKASHPHPEPAPSHG
jgi:menaquinone-dependent protoporphyrinogen oxidase